jgi:MFS family permease
VGLAFLIMALACVLAQITQRDVEPFKGMFYGMITFALAVISLAVGVATRSVFVLALGMILVGVGQGLGFMSSAVIANINVDENRRTANMSTYFLCAYIGATAPIVGVGVLADHIGLAVSVYVYVVLMTCVLLGLGFLAARQPRPRRL